MREYKGWYVLDEESNDKIFRYFDLQIHRRGAIGIHNKYQRSHIEYLHKRFPEHWKNFSTQSIIDCGANYGMFSVGFSTVFKTVHSFEMRSDVRECLRENTAQYDNIVVHDHGLSNTCAELTRDNNTRTGSTKISSCGDITESFNTVDSILIKDLGLLLLDTEGHEFDILQGASGHIKLYQPMIIAEISTARSKDDSRWKILDLMYDLDYRLIDVRHDDHHFIHKDKLP